MSLTPQQTATLKAYILTQPDLAPLTSGPGTDYNAIANLLKLDASPTTLAWRNSVQPVEIDSTTPWPSFDSLAQGKRDSWVHAFLRFPRDFSLNATRKWVTDTWGAASSGSNAEAILLGCAVENASRAEVAIGGTVRTTNAVSALDRKFVGDVSLGEIAGMFNQNIVAP